MNNQQPVVIHHPQSDQNWLLIVLAVVVALFLWSQQLDAGNQQTTIDSASTSPAIESRQLVLPTPVPAIIQQPDPPPLLIEEKSSVEDIIPAIDLYQPIDDNKPNDLREIVVTTTKTADDGSEWHGFGKLFAIPNSGVTTAECYAAYTGNESPPLEGCGLQWEWEQK